MTRTLLAMVAGVAALAALPAVAAADTATRVPRVGIVTSLAIDVEPGVAEAIGDALGTALVDKLEVDTISGAEVTRRLPAAGLPDECVSTPACITDLGRRLTADQLLFLAIVRVSGGYQIDTTFVDVASGALAARPRIQVADPAKARALFTERAVRYLPDAKVRAAAGQTVILQAGGERHRPIRPVVWTLGGAGVAALGAGIVIGLSAKSKYDGCNGARICTDGEKQSIKTRALVADLTMGVGLGCAIAAVVLYARTPVESLPVTPAVTAVDGGAVISIDGRF